MERTMRKFSVRMDDNLKTRIHLLALENNITFTEMLSYIAELGYQEYVRRFDDLDEQIRRELKERYKKMMLNNSKD